MNEKHRSWLFSTTCAAALSVTLGAANAQTAPLVARPEVTLPPGFKVLNPGARMRLVRPPSDLIPGPGKAHTNIEILAPEGGFPAAPSRASGPPQSGYLFQTPASVACDYGLVAATAGCNPNIVKTLPSGGSKAIAVVDAFDLKTAAADLAKFDARFGISAGDFTVIYGTGSPSAGCKNGKAPLDAYGTSWDLEEDLDIEYAHAMAPKAHLYLVEANSSSNADLFNAEQVATACVVAAGGGQVSNSWGVEEYAGEIADDKVFEGKNVVYFAATGDDTYPLYPAFSPNVVAVGGTTISSNPNTGAYQGQKSWYPNPGLFGYRGGFGCTSSGFCNVPIGGGGGGSAYEPMPSYQKGVARIVGAKRGIPDVSSVADPFTGVWVYNIYSLQGWGVVGGTSASTPIFAGISNSNGNFFASSNAYLTEIYALGTANKLSPYFTNMDSGVCGVPTSPTQSAPFKATYKTYGATISSQYQEAIGGVAYNECGGWGAPWTNTKLP